MELQSKITETGMTSKEFAKKIKCDYSMLSRFKTYKCLPIPPMMDKICKALECSVEDIYTKEEITFTTKKKARKKTDSYKLTVSLPKEAKEFFKKSLKKCGYRDITDWVMHCYKRLQKRFEIIENYEREKASRCNEKPKG